MTNAPLDVAVIGGGIHGAGVAQAAAAAGYSVAVLEQRFVGAGTSSRSSKLIHGGLRYLEQGQFALVRECLRERTLLLRNAPDLVRLVPYHIPIYRHTGRSRAEIATGLSLYFALAGGGEAAKFSLVRRNQWRSLDGIETKNLLAVFRYFDGQTDDIALTQAVMNSAIDLGAQLYVPAQFTHASLGDDHVLIQYQHKGKLGQLRARVLVNAAGPWVNNILREIDPPTPALQIKHVQGSHIVVSGKIDKGIYYLEAPSDGRPVFVMPWQNDQILVGTTEHVFHGNPANVRPSVEEKTYLLETLSAYFPAYRSAQSARIQSAFAGLRVLLSAPAELNDLPRDTIFHLDRNKHPRMLSIYGGKLTAYRATAEHVMQRIAPSLPSPKNPRSTTELPLKRGPLRSAM